MSQYPRLVPHSLGVACALALLAQAALAGEYRHTTTAPQSTYSASAETQVGASKRSLISRAFAATAARAQTLVSRLNRGVQTGSYSAAGMIAGFSAAPEPQNGGEDDPIVLQTLGGGWFRLTTPPITGSEANLGFNATRSSSGVVQGHFNYYNRTTGLHANGRITEFSQDVPTECPPNTAAASARFEGVCDDGSCTFIVEIVDNGEPGKRNDKICYLNVIGITNQNEPTTDLQNNRQLGGGNIQVE